MEQDKTITLPEKLAKRKYNPDFIPPKDQVVFTISELPIGVIQNFIIFVHIFINKKINKIHFINFLIVSIL
jgi:hypothetical protein